MPESSQSYPDTANGHCMCPYLTRIRCIDFIRAYNNIYLRNAVEDGNIKKIKPMITWADLKFKRKQSSPNDPSALEICLCSLKICQVIY
jgi:hypothetical protein